MTADPVHQDGPDRGPFQAVRLAPAGKAKQTDEAPGLRRSRRQWARATQNSTASSNAALAGPSGKIASAAMACSP